MTPTGMGGHKRKCGVTFEELFWAKVRKGPGCWRWIAGIGGRGYGSVSMGQRRYVASRLSWEYTYGPIPKGMWVLHKCDNRACVNPEHLFIGDNAANMADKVAKLRQVWGERTYSSKLTAAQVHEIRALEGTASAGDLADKYGVNNGSIHAIWSRKRWKHLPEQSAAAFVTSEREYR